MKSPIDSSPNSFVCLPKLESKNQLLYKKNSLSQRINYIRESQDNINKLEQLSQEFAKETSRNEKIQSFIQLPVQIQSLSSYLILQQHQLKDELNKHHDSHQHISSLTPRTHNQRGSYISQNQFKKSALTPRGRLNTVNEQDEGDNQRRRIETNPDLYEAEKMRRIINNQQQQSQLLQQEQSQKFKKLKLLKSQPIAINYEEEQFIKENWKEQQKYELQTGGTIKFLFKNLANNLQNLVNYKSEKYCITVIEKYVNYNRKLRKLIDINNTLFKDFNATLLLQRYFKILYKQIHLSQLKQANPSININQQMYDTQNQINAYNPNPLYYTKLNTFREQPSTPQAGEIRQIKEKGNQPQTIHDKQFLDNILDLNTRLEEWIMGMHQSQIQQFQTQLTDITDQVFQKELNIKNQLISHQKKQSYLDLQELIKNKYSLNLRVMKSKLSSQIRACQEKNGDLKFVNRQNINKGECIDKVINDLERLDLS